MSYQNQAKLNGSLLKQHLNSYGYWLALSIIVISWISGILNSDWSKMAAFSVQNFLISVAVHCKVICQSIRPVLCMSSNYKLALSDCIKNVLRLQDSFLLCAHQCSRITWQLTVQRVVVIWCWRHIFIIIFNA